MSGIKLDQISTSLKAINQSEDVAKPLSKLEQVKNNILKVLDILHKFITLGKHQTRSEQLGFMTQLLALRITDSDNKLVEGKRCFKVLIDSTLYTVTELDNEHIEIKADTPFSAPPSIVLPLSYQRLMDNAHQMLEFPQHSSSHSASSSDEPLAFTSAELDTTIQELSHEVNQILEQDDEEMDYDQAVRDAVRMLSERHPNIVIQMNQITEEDGSIKYDLQVKEAGTKVDDASS
ncbi:MAG: hypothetical protein ACRC5A_02100 [Enterobacteriaceae bacterium]